MKMFANMEITTSTGTGFALAEGNDIGRNEKMKTDNKKNEFKNGFAGAVVGAELLAVAVAITLVAVLGA